MTAPMKPWEQGGLNSSSPVEYSFTSASGRPVIPPRPNAVKQYRPTYPLSNGYSGYYSGSGYGYGGLGSYGTMGGFGGYSPYGGFGGYGSYGGYGYRGAYDETLENRWTRQMEESARPTFDSIESVVRVFGSMASMLDSTFFAVTNTFRAMLAVTENFGRLRTMFGRIWVSVGLFRSINWLFRVLGEKLGLLSKSDIVKDAWKEAMNTTLNETVSRSSGWPALVFLGALIAVPYILAKLNSDNIEKRIQESSEPGIKAKALYEFKASSPEELSIRPGDMVIIAPTSVQDRLGLTDSGWVQAACNGTTGMIPFSYVQPTIQQKKSNATTNRYMHLSPSAANLQSTSRKADSQIFESNKVPVVLTETAKVNPPADVEIHPEIAEGKQL